MVGESLCDLGIPSWALITLLGVVQWKQSGWLPIQHLMGPLTEQSINFLGWIWAFFANSGHFCGKGASLWSVHSLLSPKTPTWDQLLKIEVMEAGVTSSWRRQGGQFESHNGRRMCGRVFESFNSRQLFCRNRAVSNHHYDADGCCHIGQIGQKEQLLLHHKQQGFEPPTSMYESRRDQCPVDVHWTRHHW